MTPPCVSRIQDGSSHHSSHINQQQQHQTATNLTKSKTKHALSSFTSSTAIPTRRVCHLQQWSPIKRLLRIASRTWGDCPYWARGVGRVKSHAVRVIGAMQHTTHLTLWKWESSILDAHAVAHWRCSWFTSHQPSTEWIASFAPHVHDSVKTNNGGPTSSCLLQVIITAIDQRPNGCILLVVDDWTWLIDVQYCDKLG